MEEKVELKVFNISGNLPRAHAYALLLKEINGTRQLPVIIGPAEAQSIAFCLKELIPPRPFTHDLFVTVLNEFRIYPKEVFIYKAMQGVFFSYLLLEKDGADIQIDSRTSDAVALALRCGCSIYTTEEIMKWNSVNWEDGGPVTVPVTSVNMALLEESLENAVRDENYELASQIRDEIRRRKQGLLKPDDNTLNL